MMVVHRAIECENKTWSGMIEITCTALTRCDRELIAFCSMAGAKRKASPKSSPKKAPKKSGPEPDDAELKARYAASLLSAKNMFMENRVQKLPLDLRRCLVVPQTPRLATTQPGCDARRADPFLRARSSTLKKEIKRLSDYGPVLNQQAQIVQGQAKGATAAAVGMLTAGETANQLMLTGPGADGPVEQGPCPPARSACARLRCPGCCFAPSCEPCGKSWVTVVHTGVGLSPTPPSSFVSRAFRSKNRLRPHGVLQPEKGS